MTVRILKVAAFGVLLLTSNVLAQTTAFNFQGRLNDGSSPANGQYDLQFKLFDALAGGTQTGSTIIKPNTTLINGVFSTTLDFAGDTFLSDRFLEIGVRPAGSTNAFVTLGGRQQLMTVPFAMRATRSQTAGLADLAMNAVNAVNADQANIATTATDSSRLGGTLASEYIKKGAPNSGNLLMQGSITANGTLGAGGNFGVIGDATQNIPSFGLPKAMIFIGVDQQGNGFIRNCYNGFTGTVFVPCGYTLTNPLGGVGAYRIDFGFQIDGRFITTTVVSDTVAWDYGTSIRFAGPFLEIFSFKISSPNNTVAKPVMLMVY